MKPSLIPLSALDPEPCLLVPGPRLPDRLPPEVRWLLWAGGHERLCGAIRPAQARQLVQSGVAWERLPWQPVLVMPAATSMAQVAADAGAGLIAVAGPTGEPIGIVTPAVLFRRLHECYRRLEAQHHTTMDAVNDAIIVIDTDEKVLAWNWAAEQLFGIPREQILGQNHADFFDSSRQWCVRVLQTGERVRQLPHLPRDGTHVIINSLPIYVDGQIVGAVSSEQDVTRFVRLQALLMDASSRMTYLESEVGRLRQVDDPFSRIAGRSEHRERLIARLHKVAATSATVLIRGESGVGKELVAQALHEGSDRAKKPFIAINCGAIPPALFESELFGYEGGAFTGADRRGKIGRLEQANGGTLLLDEVGDLPLDMQVKLLRVLDDQKFYRVGATQPRSVDVRFIAATNRNLEQMIERGTFREDLFYRLRVVTVHVPPLRERPEDLPDLIHLFLQEFSVRYRRPLQGIEPAVMHDLLRHHWPGNVRELRNVVEQLVVLADDGVVRMEYLPHELVREHAPLPAPPAPAPPAGPVSLSRSARDAERQAILAALAATRGNRAEAARRLGISRPTLYAKFKRLGLTGGHLPPP